MHSASSEREHGATASLCTISRRSAASSAASPGGGGSCVAPTMSRPKASSSSRPRTALSEVTSIAVKAS